MKNLFLNLLFTGYLFICFNSCSSNNKEDEFLTIPVDVSQNSSLSLSDIAENVRAIELEETDQSLIGNWEVGKYRFVISDDYILFFSDGISSDQLLLFDNNGKFLHKIGSLGQGPGEYDNIMDVAADFINEIIFVGTISKIICYDFKGNFIKESKFFFTDYINFADNKLFAFKTHVDKSEISSYKIIHMIYKLNSNLIITDSIKIREIYSSNQAYFNFNGDYITCAGEDLYISKSVFIPKQLLNKPINSDTLYLLKNITLIPQLRLKFSDEESESAKSTKHIIYICKSSRYIFSWYSLGFTEHYFFCYDMKEKKGYNLKDGYNDDIHTGEKVKIRPVSSDANQFYYLHTNMNNPQKDEPNPTLYIGYLKK